MDTTIQTAIQRDMSGNRESFGAGAALVHGVGAKHFTQNGNGTSTLGTFAPTPGISQAVDEVVGHIHRTTLTLTAVPLTTVDDVTNGAQAHLAVYNFPRGLIEVRGAVLNLTTLGDGTNQTNNAALVGALGSAVPAADATLTSTEADMAPSFAGTFTAFAGVLKNLGLTPKFFDNTTTTNATQLVANLNLAIPTAGSSAAGTITVSGTITISWYNHGDN